MPITCEEVRDNLDAWALGALDSDDAAAIERHVPGCADCTIAADAARETASALALSVPMRAANPTLKARVMASATAPAARPAKSRPSALRYWPSAAAAVAVIGIGIGAWGVNAQNELNNLEDSQAVALASASTAESQYATVSTQLVMASDANEELTETQDAVTEIVSQPDAARVAMQGTERATSSSGRYVWSSAVGMGSLVARSLPPIDEDETYCLWLVYESSWVLAGKFDVDDDGTGRLIVKDLAPTSGGSSLTAYVVSIEPAGDVVEHTGDIVLRADIP